MDKYVKKIVKYAKKRLPPDRAHAIEMLLMAITGNTTIEEVDLELVNYCNLRCKWCSLDHTQKKHTMSAQLLSTFFDTLLTDRRFRSIKKLNLFNGGEILLHPDFIGMLRIVKDYKQRFSARGLPFPYVDLLTNALALSPELSRQIIDMGVVDVMRFSVDGGSREKYEEVRKGARWDTVAKNVRDFVALSGGRVATGIICIIEHGKPKDMSWMTGEFRGLCGIVDHLDLRYPHDWMGDVHVEGHRKIFINYCKFLFNSLVLLPTGDVVVCCGDLNGKLGVVGNLYKESLFDMYNSRKRREMRYNLLRGRRDKIELCKKCSGYA